MTKYHNPKTKQTIRAKNLDEALQKMADVTDKKPGDDKKVPKTTPKPKAKAKKEEK